MFRGPMDIGNEGTSKSLEIVPYFPYPYKVSDFIDQENLAKLTSRLCPTPFFLINVLDFCVDATK